MTDREIQNRLETREDFINLKRFDYSIKKLEERYPNGVPDHLIAQGLNLTEEEYEARYEEIVAQLRTELVPEDAAG